MPTYVYRRPDGTTFEAFQKMSDDVLTEDPQTGVPVTRVISGGAGLQFKGDGFYITDYVTKTGSAAESGEAPPEKKTEKKAEKAKPVDTPSKPAPSKSSTKGE